MIGSSRLVAARPVRNPPNSRLRASCAPSIRRLSSLIRASGIFLFLVRYDREASACLHNFREAAGLSNTENEDWNSVLPCQGYGRVVHDPKIPRQDVEIGK